MVILGADTSGKNGAIFLARCDAEQCDILEVVPLAGGSFSAQLVPQIATLLAMRGLGKADIDGFVVVSGPGSFTGLRVGLAAIKALAEVLVKPIAVVSLLEAVAAAAGQKGKVLAALDAGRMEIYAGEYEIVLNPRMLNQQLLSRDEFLRAARSLTVVTPDGQVAEQARAAGLKVEEIERPGASVIARLGWRKIVAGDITTPERLEANYIRRSDAEVFSKPKV